MIRSVQPDPVVEHLHGPVEPSHSAQHPVQHQQGEVGPEKEIFSKQLGNLFHLGVFILGRLLHRLVLGLYTCPSKFKVEMNRKCLLTTSPMRTIPASDHVEEAVQDSGSRQ